jgi:hypothetical protein
MYLLAEDQLIPFTCEYQILSNGDLGENLKLRGMHMPMDAYAPADLDL